MSEIIVVHEVPEGKNTGPLLGMMPFIAPTDLIDRMRAAAEWCQQTEWEFIKAGIIDRLDEVEAFMGEWQFAAWNGTGEQP